MKLEEIILSNKVIFDENGKLRSGGRNFIEFISKHAKKVIILGYKSSYAAELSFYVNHHLNDANLVLKTDLELSYYILELENFSSINSLYIATNSEELKEAEEWKLSVIAFKYKNPNLSVPYFEGLKEMTKHISNLK